MDFSVRRILQCIKCVVYSLRDKQTFRETMTDKKIGYVYILTNPSFREDWIKIGKSSRPVDVRSKELDNTAVPLPFEIYATLKTEKYSEAEKLIHHYIERFSNLRIRDNREFFNVKPEIALDIFREVAEVLEDAVIEENHKASLFVDENNVKKDCKQTSLQAVKRVWLIPSNSHYFDLEGCFTKYGKVYWAQYYNFQKGDTGYIYCASPESAVRYKFEVIENELPYLPEMDCESEFRIDNTDFESVKLHNRFALFKLMGKVNHNRLSLANLIDHGMKMAPRGALNLSCASYADLLAYIELNF